MKLVILDFDGTIGDTRNLIVKTMRETVSALNLPQRTDEQFASKIGLPLRQTFTDLIDMDDKTADLCVDTYRRIFVENDKPGAVTTFPNVVETIEELKRRGLLITIASSRSKASVLDFLEKMGLEKHIEYVLGGDDVKQAKPNPEPVIKTLKENGISPNQAIVVGDTVFDILMAHNANVSAVGVTYGNGTRAELQNVKSDYIINDFSELLDIISADGRS